MMSSVCMSVCAPGNKITIFMFFFFMIFCPSSLVYPYYVSCLLITHIVSDYFWVMETFYMHVYYFLQVVPLWYHGCAFIFMTCVDICYLFKFFFVYIFLRNLVFINQYVIISKR